jgi:hypothetical protein
MWTANKHLATFEGGIFSQKVTYTDDTNQQNAFDVIYKAQAINNDWPDADVRVRLNILNTTDISNISAGAIKPAPSKPTDPIKSQAQIDQDQFFIDYNTEKTNQVLKTLSPELQARYKSEYGRLY